MEKFGIVYNPQSKEVLRIVISDDSNYDYSLHVASGEAHIVADKKHGTDLFAAGAAVQAVTS